MLQDLSYIIAVGLTGPWLVLVLAAWTVALVGGATAAGVLAAYTGRERYPDEPVLSPDLWNVPDGLDPGETD